MQTVRPFIAAHQVDEVRRHLERVAKDSGVDPVEASRTFEQVYLPLLCQVDVSGLLSDHPLVDVVRKSDAADADTAKLAVLLGIRVLTANKGHFKEVAVEHDWLTVVAAYADTAILDGANGGIVVSVGMTTEGVVAAAQGVRRGFEYLTDHPRVAIGIGIGVLIIVVIGLIYLYDEERRSQFKRTLVGATPKVASVVAQGAAWYGTVLEAAVDAEPVLVAASLPTGNPTLPQQLARTLAASRWPVSTDQLTAQMDPDRAAIAIAVLRDHRAFVEHEDGWVLGKRQDPPA
jgi:hypothetical protein